MDRLTPEKRSELMSRVRSTGNRSTEVALARVLRSAGVRGWRRQHAIPTFNRTRPFSVTPDFMFPREKVAVFVDGCFWHGCPEHYRPPGDNAGFWADKVRRNRDRDSRVDVILALRGWRVVHLWEHDLRRDPAGCAGRVSQSLRREAV